MARRTISRRYTLSMVSAWRYPFALFGIILVLIGYAFWPKQSLIPVLIYHDIGTSTLPSRSYTVEAALLSRSLDYLQKEGYTPLTFTTATLLQENDSLPKKPIIISFDDALPGHMLAAQILRSRNLSATFFINSDLVGDSVHLSWEHVRSIASASMEIGGHTANHIHPLEMNVIGLEHEIVADKQRIETEIGKPIVVFAYPFQERNEYTDTVVERAGYTIVRDSPTFKSSVMTNSFDSFLYAL